MTPRRGRAVRVAGGVAVLGVALAVTGPDAAVDGIRSLDALTLALGVALAVPATVACAWRWHLVARGLGVGIALGPAVAACYRAQLLNTTLPGGVAGDVHRGLVHGREVRATRRALRAVVVERSAGQVVLVAVALPVLLLAPSPVRPPLPGVLLAVAVGAVAVGLALGVRWLSGPAWPRVVLASLVALACNLATYLLAARAVGVTASPAAQLPLVLLVFLAAALPTSVAGWGPREGMAVWAYGTAGIGAGAGLAVGVAFGVLVLVANLPGALVLALGRRGVRRTPAHVQPGGRRPIDA